jgi:hypothetical protein
MALYQTKLGAGLFQIIRDFGEVGDGGLEVSTISAVMMSGREDWRCLRGFVASANLECLDTTLFTLRSRI